MRNTNQPMTRRVDDLYFVKRILPLSPTQFSLYSIVLRRNCAFHYLLTSICPNFAFFIFYVVYSDSKNWYHGRSDRLDQNYRISSFRIFHLHDFFSWTMPCNHSGEGYRKISFFFFNLVMTELWWKMEVYGNSLEKLTQRNPQKGNCNLVWAYAKKCFYIFFFITFFFFA